MSAPAPISSNSVSSQLSACGADMTATAVAQVYKGDSIKKRLQTVKPSPADSLAFPKQAIVSKTYFELNSGRIVEVLEFKDGRNQCIGSFNGQPADSCREGWATYDKSTDKQWCYFVSQLEEEDVTDADDWSCGWNSFQNMVYLRTGMKVSVLEILHHFIDRLNQKTEQIFGTIKGVKNKEDLSKVMGELMPHVVSVMMLFGSEDAPFFYTLRSFTEEVLFNSAGTKCIDDGLLDAKRVTAAELIEKIRSHSFAEKGPLTFFSGTYALLLHADEGGSIIVIDPHNLKRVPDFYAQKTIQEWTPNNKGTAFAIQTQTMQGKKDHYRNCEQVNGLENDVDCAKFQEFLGEVRAREPLTQESVYERLLTLKTKMECFDRTFIEVESSLD